MTIAFAQSNPIDFWLLIGMSRFADVVAAARNRCSDLSSRYSLELHCNNFSVQVCHVKAEAELV
jgi:hypothetical protein